jgi:hypothetical protein
MAGLLPKGLQNLPDPTQGLPYAIIHRGHGIPVVYYLPYAPQKVDEVWRTRAQVHQTLEDNFVDDFSGPRALLPRVTIAGTFGYDVKFGGIGVPAHGSLHLRTFEAVYEAFNGLSRELKSQARAVQEYIDLGRLHFWRILIEGLRIRKSKDDPLLLYYELSFVRLQDYLSPVGPSLPPSTLTDGGTILGDFVGGLF